MSHIDHEHEHNACHKHSHEHSDCNDNRCNCIHEHNKEHEDHCCHEHSHEHDSCGCHEHSHEDHCCEHCEAKLHGDNTVSRLLIIRIIVSAVLFAAGFFLPFEKLAVTGPLSSFLPLAYYLWTYLIIGYDVLLDAVKNIRKGQIFDEQFLMSIATIGAFAIGDYAEGVAVMLFYQVGEMFQTMAVGKSRRSIASLMDIRPDYANVEVDGELEQVDPDEVEIGTIIIVEPGEKVPIDGIVLEGKSTLNTSALTGESVPRDVAAGDEIISGCINMTGLLKIQTTKEFGESTVSKILELVENATNKKSKSENFISKFARVYKQKLLKK